MDINSIGVKKPSEAFVHALAVLEFNEAFRKGEEPDPLAVEEVLHGSSLFRDNKPSPADFFAKWASEI